jgi:hypothetical protein
LYLLQLRTTDRHQSHIQAHHREQSGANHHTAQSL